MQHITIASQYVQALMEGYVLRGHNPAELLRSLDIPTQVLRNNRVRVSALSFSRLSARIITLLRDEAWGMLDTPLPVGALDTIVRAAFSHQHLDTALLQCSRTLNLLSSSISSRLEQRGAETFYCMEFKPGPGIAGHYAQETCLLICHRLLCWLVKEYIPLTRVHLTYPEPSANWEYQHLFYGAPVYFEQQENAIILSNEHLRLPVLQDRQGVEDLMANPQARFLTIPKRSSSMSIRLRMWMERVIRTGDSSPQLQAAAHQFGVSAQTLRRQLARENQSFRQMKEDTRRDMAIYFLLSRKHSVQEIGFRLGFSEASAFIRAFKQWTGLTPMAYQKL